MPHRLISPRTVSSQELDAMVHVLDGADILIHRFEGTVTHWSIGCENMYGWAREEAVGEEVHELLATQFPEPVENIRNQLKSRGFWQGEIIHRHKSGHEIHVASRCVLVNLPDGDLAVIQTNSDVSALKRAQEVVKSREAHLSSILDTVPDAMVVIDDKGMVLSFSKAAEKLFGMSSDQICGRNVSNLMPNPYRDAHDGYIDHYIDTGEKRIIGYGRVVTGQRADGSQFPMELHVGEATANGERIFTGFIRDLTSRYKIEEDLRQSQKMEAVGQLTGGIAHDFNNMLQTISSGLNLVRIRLQQGKTGEVEGYLRRAEKGAQRAAALTHRLLAFSRQQTLEPKSVSLGRVAREMEDMIRRAVGPSVQLDLQLTPGKWLVMCDPNQMESALLNLCVNARDAMPDGGWLTISTDEIEFNEAQAAPVEGAAAGRYATISVSDTGHGMPPEVLAHVFEPFFTTKPLGKGTGLGLSQIYGFVRQSGGFVQIESMPGKGTMVRVCLPYNATDPDSSSQTSADNGRTLLLVEDEQDVREMTGEQLRELGYRVLEADSGPAALRLMQSGPHIDLMITDIGLPGGMDGNQVVSAVRERIPVLPVIMISGYAAGPATPDTELLRKPFHVADLADRVKAKLEARHP